MKKLLAASLALLAAVSLSALDISILAEYGNNSMSWMSDAPVADANFPYTNWLPGTEIFLSEAFGDSGISFSMHYSLDPVRRSVLTGTIMYQLGIFKLGIGPMVGIFNTWETPAKAGIASQFGIDILGSFFGGIDVGSSIGIPPSTAGDYMQEYNSIYAGYYLTNAICTFSVSTKTMMRMVSATDKITDKSTEYGFMTQLFKKSLPYGLNLGFSAVKLSRDYGAGVVDSLFNLTVQTKFSWSLVPGIELQALFSGVVYSLGMDALAGRGIDPNALLFTAGLGITIRPGLYRASEKPETVEELPETTQEAQSPADPAPAPEAGTNP